MAEKNIEDFQAAAEKQIAELKDQIAKISKSLSSQGQDLADTANGRAREALHAMRGQAVAVRNAAEEHPKTAAALTATVGLAGLALGLIVAGLVSSSNR